jgi:hypothetical protein
VIEEEDRKPATIPLTKVVDKDAIESQPDVVDIVDRKPAAIQPKPLANTVPDEVKKKYKSKERSCDSYETESD